MTNDIGTGTVNMVINVPVDERLFWGRLAAERRRSIAAVKREMALRGLESAMPDRAAELREIRNRYYGAAMLALFLIAICPVFTKNHDMARRTHRVRTVRVHKITIRRGWDEAEEVFS